MREQSLSIRIFPALLILIGFCAMSASYAYSIRPEPEIIRVVEIHTHNVPVSSCKPLGKLRAQIMPRSYEMAAAIPAKALMMPKGWGR